MPRITAELRHQIQQSLLTRYRQQFGATYLNCLHKNLIPSPIEEIAQVYNVSKYAVQKIRHHLLFMGIVLREAGLTPAT
jgi:hypothetical protein